MAKKILCVIRTSTLKQEIESQKMDMINYLKSKGYKDSEIEWLEAKGASARTVNKAYLEMLDAIKSTILGSNTIKCCAVWHLNRLGRKGKYLDEMKNWFIDNHIQLICKTPQMQLLNDDGSYNVANNIIFSVYASTIEGDTLELMEKLKRGRENNRQKGKWNGEQLAFYQTVTEDGYIVVDESKLPLVRLIFSEYATGKYSMTKLTNELNSRGYAVGESAINRLLREERMKQYTEDWDKCQEVLKGNQIVFTKESKYNHLALKVLKCPHCGCNYIAQGKRRYQCYKSFFHSKRFINEPMCPSPTISIDIMDDILWNLAVDLNFQYQVQHQKESEEEREAKKAILYQKIEAANNELEATKDKKDRVNELYIDGNLTKKSYQEKLSKIEADSQSISARIKSYRDEIQQLDFPKDVDFFEIYDESIKIDKREVVLKYIKQATLEPIKIFGRKATMINVEDVYGRMYQYLYDLHARPAKLYTVKDDKVEMWVSNEEIMEDVHKMEQKIFEEIEQFLHP